MHWKFEKMFEIKVTHEHLTGVPKDPATDPPAFTVQPTLSTLVRFKKMNWMVRPTRNGLMVFAERITRTDGTLNAPKKPQKDEQLAFVIGLNRPSLLKVTKPYMISAVPDPKPNDHLPAFSGRARLLYLNNLNATPQPDGSLRITQGPFVDEPEFASRAPTTFDFAAAQAGVSSVEATAILPNPPTAISFAFRPAASKVQVELAENAYKMVQKPTGAALGERMFLTNEALPDNTLGIVSIFDVPSAPIDQNKTFHLAFAKI